MMEPRELARLLLKIDAPQGRKPNFARFRQAITSNKPGPVPIGELLVDVDTVGNFLREPVIDYLAILGDPRHKIRPRDVERGYKFVEQAIRFCAANGWDYVSAFSAIPLPGVTYQLSKNTSSQVKAGKRGWEDNNRGPIMSWDDFEQYRWPSNSNAWVFNLMARVAALRVPDGMKVMVIPGGVFDWTTGLMGLVPFCYALKENPSLVDAVIRKVSRLLYAVVEDLMDAPNIGGVFMGDDWGHATGTMVSPAVLREKFLPQVKRIVDLTHSAGKLFVFHSCGNMYDLMDDLCEMGVDAKHSFEDKIMPVEDAHHRWGHRTGIIGGLDMGILAGGSEQDVRRRTREILDACAPNGRFAMGTGNSVANYLPLGNYCAMIDETKRWNREHFGRAW